MSSTPAARAVADVNHGIILATVDIAASPERVFQALTSSDEVVKWWGSPEQYQTTEWTMDLRVGGRWRAVGVGADGKPFSVEGEVLEVDPPRKLVQTWRPDWDGGNTTKITYRVEPTAIGARVTVRHEGFGDRVESCAGHAEGWTRVLGWLGKHFAAAVETRQYYLCRLIPPRASFVADITPAEVEVMQAHAAYWAGLLQKGNAVAFGPVGDPKGAWGLGLVGATNLAEVERFRDGDPAIQSGRGFSYEIMPMLRLIH